MKSLSIVLATLAVVMTSAFAHAKSYTGKASIYWQGRLTANGESYNKYGMTAAHRTLPFGTMVRVTNLSNGRKVVLRINDRGPFIKGRIIDLSLGAGARIGLTKKVGVTRVKIDVIGRKKSRRKKRR